MLRNLQRGKTALRCPHEAKRLCALPKLRCAFVASYQGRTTDRTLYFLGASLRPHRTPRKAWQSNRLTYQGLQLGQCCDIVLLRNGLGLQIIIAIRISTGLCSEGLSKDELEHVRSPHAPH